jgi:cellulose synthase/poly-beta-1,6-N-acetylglucosamine synthase-like glycosyltransferase
MKLSVIIPSLNQFPLLEQTLQYLIEAREQESDYKIIVIDNGSDERFETDLPGVEVQRCEEPIGSYKAFDWGFDVTDSDVVAFFHSDLFVYEKGWDKKVISEFEKHSRLGMIGFVGSNEIDFNGGRGSGTTSNFQGRSIVKKETCSYWEGSVAEVHGKRNNGFTKAVVCDGCAMIIRRDAWNDIGYRENYLFHHFYDRIISCQLLEKNWNIGVLGIECDHISGQTVMHEQKYIDAAKKFCIENHITPGGIGTNWDNEVYLDAEKKFLREFRDEKHIVPIKI